ncbi:hypothetical protein AAV35_011390 [Salimicrobium jeotgali]|uniref:DNA 3'-5' helicase n=1 Tax=Salimicrobium jeotgali TaxID=1230341 RepID=K2GLP3_9BACI|nr:ATP-dependent DNA helicase [Salimicrobium jeotgali]AKG05319.1 hypothetical protein AAV35_011390 [Salimicrobium jeotgali]EKE31324.1 DNA helicase II [Salimicrobium jeotgali]MBM7696933.1 DNA helicase-2/ATP-dependent DNA helicase PcrA [Salimicrobium jeotgali]
MSYWIEKSLSEEQYQPFKSLTKNTSILAAAGSGKTRTLTHLIMKDLENGVDPKDIVIFTFTEKAAKELLSRIYFLALHHLPDVDLQGMYIGTIHGWCLKFLSEQSEYYNFTPIDELHLETLVNRLYDDLALEGCYGQPYPKGIDLFLNDLEVFYNENLNLNSEVPIPLKARLERFVSILHTNKLLTFGGMIRNSISHLENSGPLPNLSRLYVDEFQDVNTSQVLLIKNMVNNKTKLTVVGDDLQCIYNWRGSDVERIINFKEDFNDTSVHRLSSNYRSRPPIVRLANNLAERVEMKDPEKEMLWKREEPNAEAVNWLSSESLDEQADKILNIVENYHKNGVPYNKIAILLRSVVGSGQSIVNHLKENGIPVNCPILNRGGQFINEFLLPVFNWLKSEVAEPKNEEEEAEIEKETEELWSLVSNWVPVELEDEFWDGIHDWADQLSENKNYSYNVRKNLYEFLDRCNVYVAPEDNELMIGMGIGTQIIRSVEEIHRRRLSGFNRRSARGVISEVYFSLSRYQNNFGESTTVDTTQEGILVTTVHQSKGLEWPIVILPMLESKRFPVNSRPHESSFPEEYTKNYATTLEDERRLFYVALTRAKERLFLLDPCKSKPKSRSIFLKEFDEKQLIEQKDIASLDPSTWILNQEDIQDEDNSPVTVGLSDVLIYDECPYQYGLRRKAGIQPQVGDELGFGKGLHEIIQRRLEDNNPWTIEKLREQIEKYMTLPYMSEESEEKSKKAAEKRMVELERLGVFNNPVESEVTVEVLLAEGIITGVVDGIESDSNASYKIRDWKSNVHDELINRYEKQLQFYSYALKKQGKEVHAADIVDVGKTAKTKKLSSIDIDISQSSVMNLYNSLDNAVKGISKNEYFPTPSNQSCAVCDVRSICSRRSC